MPVSEEEESGDCEAYILKEVSTKDEEVLYQMVEDDVEFSAIAKVFSELTSFKIYASQSPLSSSSETKRYRVPLSVVSSSTANSTTSMVCGSVNLIFCIKTKTDYLTDNPNIPAK